MAQKPFTPDTVVDGFASFEAGMNSDVAPLLLQPNQLSFLANGTVRGTYATHRPPFNKQTLDFGGSAALRAAVLQGLWQGAQYYKPDQGMEQLLASISGRLFLFTPAGTTWTVKEVTIPGDANDPTITQAFLWQAEKWMFITDGTTKLPIYFDGTSSRRSIGNDASALSITAIVGGALPSAAAIFTVTLRNDSDAAVGSTIVPGTYHGPIGPNFTPFVVPAIGGTVVVTTSVQYTGAIPLPAALGADFTLVNASAAPAAADMTVTLAEDIVPQWAIGTPISGLIIGAYIVKSWVSSNQVILTRINNTDGQPGGTVPTLPTTIYPEFPAGRCGAYGMGRVWMSLIDAKQFVGGDIVDYASGTYAYNYRDAVLRTSANTQLLNGGYFTTPGAWGDIRAMIFQIILDASMGQGPLMVLTPSRTFSCQTPVDQTTWNKVTNPILTESLITNGAEGFYSTVTANGDVMFRAVDGIRSLIVGRRDFTSWGNVPVSSEMDRVLQLDVQELLSYSSAIVFDNRLLMTAAPTPEPGHGVFHRGIVALNFDPLSTIRGKQPSVYDGLWTGPNVLQLVVGRFQATERAFAFAYNQGLQEIELYEIGTTPTDVFGQEVYPPPIEIYDNGNTAIVWSGESPVMFKAQDPRLQEFHQLLDGEILVDNLVGTVDFEVYYKPDQHPCWQPWFAWQECAPKTAANSKPQFRPRMGLGQPPSAPCDPTTNRPYREAYTFQIKWIVRGHCRVLGGRFKAVTQPIPTFAKQQCKTVASTFSIT